jgi:hypothetical protein
LLLEVAVAVVAPMETLKVVAVVPVPFIRQIQQFHLRKENQQ